jgi:hypothetical protein
MHEPDITLIKRTVQKYIAVGQKKGLFLGHFHGGNQIKIAVKNQIGNPKIRKGRLLPKRPGFFLSAKTPKIMMDIALIIKFRDIPIEARIESKLIV